MLICFQPREKAKPVERRGRKATGLEEIAGLPGKGSPVFFVTKKYHCQAKPLRGEGLSGWPRQSQKEFIAMKKMLIFVLVMALGALVGGPAQATTITFEDLGLYSTHASLDYGNVIFTSNFPGTYQTFYVYDTSDSKNSTQPVPIAKQMALPMSGKVIIGDNSHDPTEVYIATFKIGGVRSVSVDLGDFGDDADHLFLNAYGSSGWLASTDYTIPATLYGGHTLSVFTSEDIKYVTFGTDTPFPGSVYFDNFTYVPLPGAVWLLGSGLLGLVGLRRYRKL
jgi:hypothetical protein